jgi:DNA-binding MarR family transcriptional regulator
LHGANDLPEVPAVYDGRVDAAREAVIARIVATFDLMMDSVATAHAPEFLEVGVTMSQAKVLYLVQAAPDVRMSDLSARLGVSLSTVSGVVDRLVDQGLLNRRDDPADRRHVILRLTDAGTTQLELFRELNEGQIRSLLSRIDAADLVVIGHALDVLANAAARGAAAPPASPSRTTQGDPA